MSFLAIAVSASAAFNLICSGTMMTGTGSGFSTKVEKNEEFTRIYRVDLDDKRWCVGDCAVTHELKSVEPTFIMFEDDKTIEGHVESGVSRENGGFARKITGGLFFTIMTGECKRAPFTGFPAIKF